MEYEIGPRITGAKEHGGETWEHSGEAWRWGSGHGKGLASLLCGLIVSCSLLTLDKPTYLSGSLF